MIKLRIVRCVKRTHTKIFSFFSSSFSSSFFSPLDDADWGEKYTANKDNDENTSELQIEAKIVFFHPSMSKAAAWGYKKKRSRKQARKKKERGKTRERERERGFWWYKGIEMLSALRQNAISSQSFSMANTITFNINTWEKKRKTANTSQVRCQDASRVLSCKWTRISFEYYVDNCQQLIESGIWCTRSSFGKSFLFVDFRIPCWERCFSFSRFFFLHISSSTLFCFSYKDARTAANMLFVFLRVLWKTRSSDQMIFTGALTCFDSSTLFFSFFFAVKTLFSLFDRHCIVNDEEKEKNTYEDIFITCTDSPRWKTSRIDRSRMKANFCFSLF